MSTTKQSNLTKEEFIKQLTGKTGFSQEINKKVLRATLDLIKENLKEYGVVRFIGFGKFEAKEVAERTMRNPLNGKMINVPKSKRIRFSAGNDLKTYLNPIDNIQEKK